MTELAKKITQFKVEIRRQQFQQKFSSARRNILQSISSEAFISQHMHMLRQGQSPSIILNSMRQQLENSNDNIRSILCETSAVILTQAQLSLSQEVQVFDLAQLLLLVLTHLDADVKGDLNLQPFVDLLSQEIVRRWLNQRSFNNVLFQAVLLMQNQAYKQSKCNTIHIKQSPALLSKQQQNSFEQQIYILMEQQNGLMSEESLKVLLVALRRTPPRKLATKTKKKLYQLAKAIYYRQIEGRYRQWKIATDLVLQVLCVKGVEEQEKSFLFNMLNRDRTTQRGYKLVLRLLKLQTNQNYWITYNDIKQALKKISSQLRSSSDTISFLIILHNLIINEIQSPSTIQQIYSDYFKGKLEAYLQLQPLIPVFSEILSFFSLCQSLSLQEQQLVDCSLSLLNTYHSVLQEKIKQKLLLWLMSKQKLKQCEVAHFLTNTEARAFFRQFQNNQSYL